VDEHALRGSSLVAHTRSWSAGEYFTLEKWPRAVEAASDGWVVECDVGKITA
jgi:hypothetical protein